MDLFFVGFFFYYFFFYFFLRIVGEMEKDWALPMTP